MSHFTPYIDFCSKNHTSISSISLWFFWLGMEVSVYIILLLLAQTLLWRNPFISYRYLKSDAYRFSKRYWVHKVDLFQKLVAPTLLTLLRNSCIHRKNSIKESLIEVGLTRALTGTVFLCNILLTAKPERLFKFLYLCSSCLETSFDRVYI